MTLLSRAPNEVLERIAPDLVRPMETVKREAVESAMILCQGNFREAAFRLGISRATLYRLLKRIREEN